MVRYLLSFSLLLVALGSHAQYVEGDTAIKPKPLQQPALVAPSPNQATPANSTPAPKLIDKFNFGGNFGASFGSFTYLDLSPVVTYQLTPRLFIGPGVTYIYTSYFDQYRERVKDSRYGGRLVARYLVFNNFFLQGLIHIIKICAKCYSCRIISEMIIRKASCQFPDSRICLNFYKMFIAIYLKG
jgi:hypothetical protein